MRYVTLAPAALLLATVLHGQSPTGWRSAVLMERYDFDAGLTYEAVTQATLPLTATADLGDRTRLVVSGGFTWARLTPGDAEIPEAEIRGPVDTEARLLVTLIPERLTLLVSGVVPTGTEALEVDELDVAGALVNRAIGYAVPNLGSGGQAGVGFVGAVPWDDMALGLGATYVHAVAYAPVPGQNEHWKPGGQWRFRGGVEGPVGPRTYLRATTELGLRGEDSFDDDAVGTAGRTVHGYVSVNHGTDSGSLTVYVMDSYRSAPQVEATSLGPVRMPRGNLFAVGGRMEFRLGGALHLVPRVEYRNLREALADAETTGSLDPAGSTLRLGSDLRVAIGSGLGLVFEANGLFGNVGDGVGSTVGVRGLRAGVHLAVLR
ncbi:MAG: hypothetical protein HKN71_11360 [Gemmatimonadetes bacterium]|nr:hypothetical protein [Gemmatimonadota bacterium]